MTHKHEFKVVQQEYLPNKENVQKVEISVEAEINGDKKTETKRFEPKQVSDGRWEKHFCRWIEQQQEKIEIPDLESEIIKNSGYDFTGPEREYKNR